MAACPLIDIYCHIFPERFFQEMIRVAPNLTNIGQRLRNVKKLFDLDLRFGEMDQYGDYRQVISLPNPPIEDLAGGETGLALARIGNDAMAELARKHPDRFAGFVAAVSLTDVDGSIAEARRAVGDLGACGIQVFTSIAGRPLDDAAFLSPGLRRDGEARPADLAASRPHRRHERLRGRAEVALRDVVVLRLAL